MKRYHYIFSLLSIGIMLTLLGCEDSKDVTGVEIHPAVVVLQVGETAQLTATIFPNDADNKSVKWFAQDMWTIDSSASASDVISITELGKVKGLAEGKSKVTCITNNMFYEANATIWVGYAVAAGGTYKGTLKQNDAIIAEQSLCVTIERIAEDKAIFHFTDPITNEGYDCDVDVSYFSEKLNIEGESMVYVQNVATMMKVSGMVNMEALGSFNISLGDASMQFSFIGQKI